MILVDNNILSSFARVEAIDSLFALFPRDKVGIASAVYGEVLTAIGQGCGWLDQVRLLLDDGKLHLVAPTAAEILAAGSLPDSLGSGERESIVICTSRKWGFLTNDKRARNYCREVEVEAYDLAGLLRAMWESQHQSKQSVRRLVERMESVEGMVFRNKEAIFRK